MAVFCFGGCACQTEPRVAGEAIVLLSNAPEALDRRFTLSANGQRVASLLAPGLVRVDDSGRPVPDLAESFERVGPTRYRFVLRRGLTFHDGGALTSADVVYTYRSLVDPEVGSPLRPKYERITSVEAVDPRTVEIELDAQFAPLLLDLTMGIVPARLADTSYRAAFEEHPIGAGPYRFVERPDEEHIVFAPFDDYYGGRPEVERLVFVVVRDETTRVLSMLRGDADLVINAVSPVLLPRLEAAPHLRLQQRPGAGYAYLGFNFRQEHLADRRVRQAIAHAIDRDALTRYKFKGAATPATGMLPEGHWAYAEAPRFAYDPARARALLDEAGLPDPDGNGPEKRFTITYKTSTDRFRKSVALLIAAQLEEVGIGVDLRAYEWGTFYGDVKRGRFELMSLKWTPVIEPHLYHWVFHSDSIPTEDNSWTGGNRGGYKNPQIDTWIDQAASELDPQKRAALYANIQRVVGEDLPYVSLWHEDTVAVVNERLEGFEVSPFGFFHPLANMRVR